MKSKPKPESNRATKPAGRRDNRPNPHVTSARDPPCPLRNVVPAVVSLQRQAVTSAHLNTLYGDLLIDGRTDGKGGLSASTV